VRTSLIVTLIGEDRPGIVEAMSDLVLAAAANWEESRMARLAGRFAGILHVSVDTDRAPALAAGLTALQASGLTVVVETGRGGTEVPARSIGLAIVGHDRPGIVRDISNLLARRGVNIEELETEVTSAPTSGDTLFHARARLRSPQTVDIDELRTLLESLAADLMVDLAPEEGR